MRGSSETQLKSMRLNRNLIAQIEKMAEKENRNFTNMVETILKDATKK